MICRRKNAQKWVTWGFKITNCAEVTWRRDRSSGITANHKKLNFWRNTLRLLLSNNTHIGFLPTSHLSSPQTHKKQHKHLNGVSPPNIFASYYSNSNTSINKKKLEHIQNRTHVWNVPMLVQLCSGTYPNLQIVLISLISKSTLVHLCTPAFRTVVMIVRQSMHVSIFIHCNCCMLYIWQLSPPECYLSV